MSGVVSWQHVSLPTEGLTPLASHFCQPLKPLRLRLRFSVASVGAAKVIQSEVAKVVSVQARIHNRRQ